MADPGDLQKQMEFMTGALEHCVRLGLRVLDARQGWLRMELPYSQEIVGNPATGVIHGGPLTTLMDTACGIAAFAAMSKPGLAPTLDLRIDYMGAAQPGLAVIGEGEAYRITRNVIFCRGLAYHESQKDKPIAHCTATFMRLEPAAAGG